MPSPPMTLEMVLLICAGLMMLSVLASQAAAKLGLPVVPVFILIGMLAGADGPGRIWFEDAKIAQEVGLVALAFILFAGGMDTDWKSVRPHLVPALALSTLGVVITSVASAAFVHYALGFNFWSSLLLGVILAPTDAAAVFATLRSQGLRLPKKLSSIIELESGANDPLAVFLTLTVTAAALSQRAPGPAVLLTLAWQMGLGALGGWLIGRLGVLLMRRLKLQFEALYHVVSIVIALTAYAGIHVLGGSGLLAVFAAGLAFGQGDFHQKKGLRRFHDGIAWLMQITMFICLGLLVFPNQLLDVAAASCLLALILMVVARPIGVLLCLGPLRTSWREQAVVSAAGLRGAAPIVLATFPLLAGVKEAQLIFNVVFFVVLLSVTIQGSLLPWIARRALKEDLTPRPSS